MASRCLSLWYILNRTLAVGAELYTLKLSVKNNGDDAYNAKLKVTIPKDITIQSIFKIVEGKVG
mgnify:FL=1